MDLATNTVRYYHADALGSIIGLSNETGQMVTTYAYDAFGHVTISGEMSDNPFQYTGRENDGTGLYYYRAMYYSPELQRFVSEDPIGLNGGDVNFYAYVGSNPTKLTDFSGLSGIIGGGGGFEGHALFGGGFDSNYCCDGHNRWRVRTFKVCLGDGLGYSDGGNVVVKGNQNQCPDMYEGFTLEGGGGPAECSFSFSDPPVLICGVGGGGGGKFTVCYNHIYDKQIVGKCCD